ncbi:MAG: hypothetical protein D6715_12760 [Calditrichaeota bacterium]|nr:MAG: hypothetical protein D6715_12760 [Calditrichota bacterium]
MKLDHLALDIETVPAAPLEAYSATVQDKIQQKLERIQERRPEMDFDYFASTHGDFGQIICISVGYINQDLTIHLKSFFGEDEKQILEGFNQLIAHFNGVFIHYNGLTFDVPFILQRMAYHRIQPSNNRFGELRRYQREPHFDVMLQYYNWDMSRALPLGILAELHQIPSPKEDLSGDQVFQAYQKGEWAKIVRYCEFDVATTLNLWHKIFRYQDPLPIENYRFSQAGT